MKTSVKGKAIRAGYDWLIRLSISGHAPFPVDATFVAHVRRKIEDETPLTILTTANGGVVRTGLKSITVSILGVDSASWASGDVIFDVVRTDEGNVHLGFSIVVPVKKSATRITP